MSKYKVGDKVLRGGAGKIMWVYTVVAVKGWWIWQKVLITSSKNSDMFIEEQAFNLYPYPQEKK